jgi:hypothetical protein
MMQIYKVPKNDVGLYWFQMRDFLDDALKKYNWHHRFPLDMLPIKLMQGDYQSFLIYDNATKVVLGALVTEVISYPLGDALNIFLLGGNEMQKWVSELDISLTLYAKEIGAKWIDTGTRRGIGKLYYPAIGYKEIQTSYTKEI